MQIEIIPYSTNYKEHVLKIFLSYPSLFPQSEISELTSDLLTYSTHTHYKAICAVEGKIVGYIESDAYGADSSYRQVKWLAVAPQFQNSGVGKKLMDHVFAQTRNLGIYNLIVETCTCDGEKPARKFYEKNGFQKETVFDNFYAPGHSKVVYHKLLNK